jgi:hypothetical protein
MISGRYLIPPGTTRQFHCIDDWEKFMTSHENPPDSFRGTRAIRPDLDWSQVKETVLILELVAGQVMAAMRDSDNSVEVLANTFTTMAGYVRNMSEIVQDIPTTPENISKKTAALGIADQVGGMINQAVMSFQFYDKLIQRLSHVAIGLGDISELVGNKVRLYNPEEWTAMQERFRSKFSTREELALFEAVVINGVPVATALETYIAALHDKGDEIDFF